MLVYWCIVEALIRRPGETFLSPELEIHQSKGFLDKDVLLLTLEDPKARIGSGGATINALLVVTEHLSAKAGYEVQIFTCIAPFLNNN